ncbi:Peptidase_S49 domain-containing protein [Tenacibaculum sp. 190524A02b]|uniref:Peptidase_S49 domain-containing protein n=2 Tax=Tenacibaculum vairaonense TaxID=3137860 RepID=A0ABM9PIQ3_9FLAO
MITDESANSLYPYLLNILNKGDLPQVENSQKVSSFYYMNISADIFDEETYDNTEEEQKEQVVAILPIKGPILKYSQFCGPQGTKALQSKLEKLKADDNVIAVLLDIDSGGGQVAGTAEFAQYIYNYPKRIESYTDGGIASAAYHIAAPTKKITANPNSDYIGSIGTMFKTVILDGYFEQMGAKVEEHYATKSTKKNHAFRKLKEGDPKPLKQEELDPINEDFHAKIKMYRPDMDESVYNGHHTVVMSDALEKGLIDAIADKKTVIAELFESAKQEKSENKNNNQNQIDMADEKVNLERISATLKLQEEGGLKLSSKILSGKKGVFLTVEQLQAIEASLPNESEQSNKTQNELDKSNQENQSLKNAITEALKTADLQAKDTPEASIKMLGDKVVEYGAQPGETPTSNKSQGDRFQNEDNVVNQQDEHNLIYNSL